MKKLFITSIIFTITATAIFAAPELKIEDTNFKCSQNSFASSGYDECKLNVKLRINDYEYLEKYNKLQYNVKCSATFDYQTSNSFTSYPLQNREENSIRIYGTNKYDYLDITTHFYSLQSVTQVRVSKLTCEVKDIY